MVKYGVYFAEPLWFIACLLLVPVIWQGLRNLSVLGRGRRTLAITFRSLAILILIAVLARMMFTRSNEHITVLAVIDRSESVPEYLQESSIEYLSEALSVKKPADLFAVVDIAETASISSLPSGGTDIRKRNTTLAGVQSRLSDGVQMAMAIAPPDTAARILMVSDGNQTAGDLKETARIAAANGIPIDILPLRYSYENEVVFKRLAVPASARSGQTISLRFILSSTSAVTGKLVLNLNGKLVDLLAGSDEVAVPIELKPGTNVKTVSIPVGSRGVHDFQAYFVPDDPGKDRVIQNNRSSALTFVAGPGHIMVFDADGSAGAVLTEALKSSDIDARHHLVEDFPSNLAYLMNTDAVILVNTDSSNFTFQQQEVISRYVTDFGGGLIMTGGEHSFGAGGWIGSPVAEILPVDLDPPQKKQMPKGALCLIMHACEIPEGNLWGKRIAKAAVNTLGRQDLIGVLAYGWQSSNDWVHQLSPAGDKKEVNAKVDMMSMGDMPDLGALLQKAYDALKDADASQKHVVVISDGDPQPPVPQLLANCKAAGITCSGVAINPHSPTDIQSLQYVARETNGRFYYAQNPAELPRIFVKEAQTVRRALINEETFTPHLTYSLNEITRGISFPLPSLDGYVLTGPREGLSQIILSSHTADPILATCQSGLGRCIAFTSSVDSMWASSWISWSELERFWEQAVRWVAKSSQSSDCQVFVDVQGRDVSVNVEAVDAEGGFMQFASIDAQILSPDVSSRSMNLFQIGPGQWQGNFKVSSAGSYIVNLRYRKIGEDSRTYTHQVPVTVPFAPEYRDLTDNTVLLEEVSRITGGRVLDADPLKADIFDQTGLKYPQTQLPLTKPLMLIWLGVFLVDISVRRISIDFAAILKRGVNLFKRTGKSRQAGENIQRLQITRQRVSDLLSKKSQKQKATTRYDGTDKKAGTIPVAEDAISSGHKSMEVEKKTKKPKKKTDDLPSHIDQLLKARKRTSDKTSENDN